MSLTDCDSPFWFLSDEEGEEWIVKSMASLMPKYSAPKKRGARAAQSEISSERATHEGDV